MPVPSLLFVSVQNADSAFFHPAKSLTIILWILSPDPHANESGDSPSPHPCLLLPLLTPRAAHQGRLLIITTNLLFLLSAISIPTCLLQACPNIYLAQAIAPATAILLPRAPTPPLHPSSPSRNLPPSPCLARCSPQIVLAGAIQTQTATTSLVPLRKKDDDKR